MCEAELEVDPGEAAFDAGDPAGDAFGAGECDEAVALAAADTPGEAEELDGAPAESAADVASRSIFPFSRRTLKRSSMSCSSRPFDGITTYCEREGSSSADQAVILATTATSV